MRPFNLTIKDSILRTMNREQYKACAHWLRLSARKIHGAIDWAEAKRAHDTAVYGTSIVFIPNR